MAAGVGQGPCLRAEKTDEVRDGGVVAAKKEPWRQHQQQHRQHGEDARRQRHIVAADRHNCTSPPHLLPITVPSVAHPSHIFCPDKDRTEQAAQL